MGKLTRKYNIKDFLSWIVEATEFQQLWHKESFEDYAFRDGAQWSAQDKLMMMEKDINPITANRIFPIINLIYGHNTLIQEDIVAKGRTQDDAESSQVMTEAISFVLDQCEGKSKIREADFEAIVAGFGYLKVDTLSDPRREKVTVKHRPWYSLGWDPYGDPWLSVDSCRYCFYSDWVDLEDLIAAFPKKEMEIRNQFDNMTSGVSGITRGTYRTTLDTVDAVEDIKHSLTGSQWANSLRNRVRPVELYYRVNEEATFCTMFNGAVYELNDSLSKKDQYKILKECIGHQKVVVPKVRLAQIIGEEILEDIPSPHGHDQYPFVPMFAYLDRFNMPFGVPRQVKEQQMEINKRRSVALALLDDRTAYIEDGAVDDINEAYEQINSRRGLVEVNPDKLDRIKIDEHADLATAQVDMMRISESEMKEITGANDESLGYETKVMSGTALSKKQQQTSTIISPLSKNLARSKRRLGELIIAEVQSNWDGPRVMRVTDRVTGADRFVEINQPLKDENGNMIVKNNISQGRYDSVVSSQPLTDTARERHVEMLFSAIEKSPPEIAPTLISMALELSDLPAKEMLLARINAVLGTDPIEFSLSKDEQEQRRFEKQQAIEAKQNQDAEFEKRERILELDEREAKIKELYANIEEKLAAANQKQGKAETDQFQLGYRLQADIMKQREARPPLTP